MKKLKAKSPGKNLAVNLWNAYFMDTLERKDASKDTNNLKERKKKINPKEHQKIHAFDMNVKKLKEGFLHLPHMQMEKTKKIKLKKEELSEKEVLETTKRLQRFQTTLSST